MRKPAQNPNTAVILSVALCLFLLIGISMLFRLSPSFILGMVVGSLVGTWLERIGTRR